MANLDMEHVDMEHLDMEVAIVMDTDIHYGSGYHSGYRYPSCKLKLCETVM